MDKLPFLKVNNINKRYGKINALNNICMDIYLGEIVAIVGDNGAGKSTLIKILSGALSPDDGEITVGSRKYDRLSPKQSLHLGISTVYQDLSLVDTLDAPSNIFLGREESKYLFLNQKSMIDSADKLIKDLGINIPFLRQNVGALSGGQRQGIAVARAIHQGGKLIIFDEPTAAMGLTETGNVLKLIKGLAEKNLAVIVISHNLQQVFEISHKICVLRQGKMVGIFKTKETTSDHIVKMITGVL